MLKRVLTVIFILSLSFLLLSNAFASGFSQNADAIEAAAKSVLMLGVFDSSDQLIGTGSGFCAINSGILITNYHVIEDARRVIAVDDNEREYSLNKVLCADEEMDIAILGFEYPTALKPLPLKPDNQLKRGSPVVAIGSPKGYRNTVSLGNISSQYEENGTPWIRITAPISPGSSGGALFNDEGQIIGVTSAVSAYQDAQNINYAINIAVAQAMYNAWDGKYYSFSNFKSSAKMDFSNVYNNSPDNYNTNTSDQDTGWDCPNCGAHNQTRFCSECGKEKPEWICACGQLNHGKFCGQCGRSIAEMIEKINSAFSLLEQNQYAEAVAFLEQLEQFNCVSMETSKGKNIVAHIEMQAAYYQWAEDSKKSNADIETIVSYYQKAASYLDAESKVFETYYEEGLRLFNTEEYETAKIYFQKAGDYKDSKTKVNESDYLAGKKLYEQGFFQEAIGQFEKANHFDDTDQMILASHYAIGLRYLEEKEYNKAINEFGSIENYKDSKDRMDEAHYLYGKELYNKGDYNRAIDHFKISNHYQDADQQILTSHYAFGLEYLTEKEYSSAISEFDLAGDYLDAKEQIKGVYYHQGLEALEQKAYDTAISLFTTAKDYSDAPIRVLQCYYQQGLAYLETGAYDNAKSMFFKAKGYLDAEEKIKETDQIKWQKQYAAAQKSYFKKDYLAAAEKFEDCEGYSDAATRKLECYYLAAQQFVQEKEFERAIRYYSTAGAYSDAHQKTYDTKKAWVNYLISQEKYSEANKIVLAESKTDKPLGSFTVLKIGSKRKAVGTVLAIAKGIGLLSAYPSGETEYKAEYESAVKKLEKELKMKADGVITLDEMMTLSEIIYPTKNGTDVKKFLEKLSDLGYFSSLPKSHSKYEKGYMEIVKKAEKALKLQADGYITREELNTIKNQKVKAPDVPKTFKASVSGANVTLTWSAVKGNVWYKVYRGNKLIATTKDKKYIDKNVKTGLTYQYSIEVCKYETSSNKKHINCTVKKYYKAIDIVEFNNNPTKYQDDYVSFSNWKLEGQELRKGGYLYSYGYKVVNGKYYFAILIFENYNNWGWEKGKGIKDVEVISISGKGKVPKDAFAYDIERYSAPVIVLESINWSYK